MSLCEDRQYSSSSQLPIKFKSSTHPPPASSSFLFKPPYLSHNCLSFSKMIAASRTSPFGVAS
ncbi:MAG TPA: hypothetical protein DDW73_18240 [Rhizobium sp.]|nr:hypothetical protein [Rhizobium sp.]